MTQLCSLWCPGMKLQEITTKEGRRDLADVKKKKKRERKKKEIRSDVCGMLTLCNLSEQQLWANARPVGPLDWLMCL